MSYPLIGLNHQILGTEFCSGYKDITGNWNTGFFCPGNAQLNEPVYCCGTLTYKYCCIQQQNEGVINASMPNQSNISVNVPVHLNRSPVTIGLAATGATLFLSVLIYITCYFCSCCYYYRKRGGIQNGDIDYYDHHDEPTFPVSSGPPSSGLAFSLCEGTRRMTMNPFHPAQSLDLSYHYQLQPQTLCNNNNNNNPIIEPRRSQLLSPNQSISLSTINSYSTITTNNNNNYYSYPYTTNSTSSSSNGRLYTISGNSTNTAESQDSEQQQQLSPIDIRIQHSQHLQEDQNQPKPISFVNIRNNVAYITSVMPLFSNPNNNNNTNNNLTSTTTTRPLPPTPTPTQIETNNTPLLSPKRTNTKHEDLGKIGKSERQNTNNNSTVLKPQVLLRNPTSSSTSTTESTTILLSPSSTSRSNFIDMENSSVSLVSGSQCSNNTSTDSGVSVNTNTSIKSESQSSGESKK